MRGDFPTFESMLCHLVVSLVEVKDRFLQEALRNAQLQLPPTVILTTQKNLDNLKSQFKAQYGKAEKSDE
jgi:hypothetical protein